MPRPKPPPAICVVLDCDAPARRRGRCERHAPEGSGTGVGRLTVGAYARLPPFAVVWSEGAEYAAVWKRFADDTDAHAYAARLTDRGLRGVVVVRIDKKRSGVNCLPSDFEIQKARVTPPDPDNNRRRLSEAATKMHDERHRRRVAETQSRHREDNPDE